MCKRIIVWCFLLLLLSCSKDHNKIYKPNVLFISMDDLNDWIEPLGGHPQAITPNLKRLAAESVNFSRAYCSSPGCNPSRTSVMTGLAPHTSGVYSNYQDWRELIPDRVSMGAYFRKHGYYSSGAGKIFHYFMVDSSCWDDYWPSQKQNMPVDYPVDPDKHDGSTYNMPEFENMYMSFDWAPLQNEDSQMGDFKSVEYIAEQLRKDHDKPFFLACGIYRPHLPWYVPEIYFDMFPLESIQLPAILENDLDDVGDRARDIASRGGGYHQHVLKAGQWEKAVQAYLASIAFADAMLGRLLDALEKSQFANNTVVVLWSDHGWQLGEKEHWRKFALWENVVQSVLMIKVPEGTPGLPEGSSDGSTCKRVVSLQDIYPSLLDICGLPARDDIDGRSLVQLLRDPGRTWDFPALTSYDFSEFSVRNERWRYTVYLDGSEELYDHSNDPEEWTNLANNPKFIDVKMEMAGHIPENPAPLKKTSLKLQPHHLPPFKSTEEYWDWRNHGKDYNYFIEKYWNQ